MRAFDLFREPDTEHALEGRQGLPERLHGEVGVGIPFAVVAVFIERIIDELAELEDHSGQVRLELLRRVFRRDGERAQDPTAGDMTDQIDVFDDTRFPSTYSFEISVTPLPKSASATARLSSDRKAHKPYRSRRRDR